MKKHQSQYTKHSAISTNAEKFWYGWLKIAATIVTLFGIVLSLYTIISGNGLEILNEHIAKAFRLSPQFMVDMRDVQAWMVGVIGATTAGWGLTLMYLIFVPLKRKEKWAWNAITFSLVLWFILDTWISTHYGAKFNVVLNIAFAMQFFAPLLFIRSTMKKEK